MEKLYTSDFEPSREALTVLQKGRILQAQESPEMMIERVVSDLSLAEFDFGSSASEVKIFANAVGTLIDNKQIVLSTPILTNAGRKDERPLSACTVPPVDLRGDLSQIKQMIDSYHQNGMGTGFNLNNVDNPVEVLGFLNEIAIAGAESGLEERPVGNIAICRIDHPKIIDFINAKVSTPEQAWKFNISVDVPEAFWKSLGSNDYWELRDGSRVEANRIFELLISSAFQCGDPGVVFLDKINADNPTPGVGSYLAIAPCAEVGLVAGETCQFGYVNLGKFLHLNGTSQEIDYKCLSDASRLMVRILDNALEQSLKRYQIDQTKSIVTAKRKIGVGVCGLADLFIALDLPYDSPQARIVAQNVISFINFQTKIASTDLAKKRGSFGAMYLTDGCRYMEVPGYIEQKYGQLETDTVSSQEWLDLGDYIRKTRFLRNCSTTALPPTGRSSLIVDASASVEPIFNFSTPSQAKRMLLDRLAQLFANTPKGLDTLDYTGSCQSLNIPGTLKGVFKTAVEIDISGHLAMVSAIQPCIDESISKTINLPHQANQQTIGEIYSLAYSSGLKGVTVYRDGSVDNQPQKLVQEIAKAKDFLCFVGPSGAGKDTVIEKLKFLTNGSYYSLSDVVRQQAALAGYSNPTRGDLQILANDLRTKYGNGVMAMLTIDNLIEDPLAVVIVNGIRHPDEISVIQTRTRGRIRVVGVDTTREIRFQRILARNRPSDPKDWEEFINCDIRENGTPKGVDGQQNYQCLKMADVIINNNGTLDELNSQVRAFYLSMLNLPSNEISLEDGSASNEFATQKPLVN